MLHLKPIKKRYCISSLAFTESVLLSGSASALHTDRFKFIKLFARFFYVLYFRCIEITFNIFFIGNRFQIGRLFMAFYFIESRRISIFFIEPFIFTSTHKLIRDVHLVGLFVSPFPLSADEFYYDKIQSIIIHFSKYASTLRCFIY